MLRLTAALDELKTALETDTAEVIAERRIDTRIAKVDVEEAASCIEQAERFVDVCSAAIESLAASRAKTSHVGAA